MSIHQVPSQNVQTGPDVRPRAERIIRAVLSAGAGEGWGQALDAGILGRAPGPFPLRFLGFGLFWAWLFLAGVSSSPLFGPMECVLGMPFELVQVSLRAVALGCVIVVSGVLPRGVGIRVLICLRAR